VVLWAWQGRHLGMYIFSRYVPWGLTRGLLHLRGSALADGIESCLISLFLLEQTGSLAGRYWGIGLENYHKRRKDEWS
jgi:hypothetical protein